MSGLRLHRHRASFETRPCRGAPCISHRSSPRRKIGGAVADESPLAPRARKPAPEHGASSVGSPSPNSRRGRQASPHAQGRDMEHFIGIDVAKDRLDICVRPDETTFTVARDGEGLAVLVERLQALAPSLVVLEATGGYETVVAGAIAAAGLPLAVV